MPTGVYVRSQSIKSRMRKRMLNNTINKNRTPWNKGKKGVQTVSEETRIKISLARLGNKNAIGNEPWNKGKKVPQLCGEKHPNWKGGKAKDKRIGVEYINWRAQVYKRDNFTCQACNKRGGDLEAHHVKAWSSSPELRHDLNNGVTLCRKCHELTFNYKGRKYELHRDDSDQEDQGSQETN